MLSKHNQQRITLTKLIITIIIIIFIIIITSCGGGAQRETKVIHKENAQLFCVKVAEEDNKCSYSYQTKRTATVNSYRNACVVQKQGHFIPVDDYARHTRW
jgi:uncharacterized lipoprotein YehR (DUF1307 family)